MVKKNDKLISKIQDTTSLVDFYKLKQEILIALGVTLKVEHAEGDE